MPRRQSRASENNISVVKKKYLYEECMTIKPKSVEKKNEISSYFHSRVQQFQHYFPRLAKN